MTSTVNAQFVSSTAELAIPVGTQTNEVNADIETQTLASETLKKIAQWNHYVLFLVEDNFLFDLSFLVKSQGFLFLLPYLSLKCLYIISLLFIVTRSKYIGII